MNVMTTAMRTLILQLIVIVIRNIHLALASETWVRVTIATLSDDDLANFITRSSHGFLRSLMASDSPPLETMSPNLSLPPTLWPQATLRHFAPFMDWALFPIHHRLELLGVTWAGIFMRRVLCQNKEGISTLHPSESISEKDPADIATIHLVVQQAGWLTWDEYCYLIVAGTYSAFAGGAPALRHWAKDPERLQKELDSVTRIMRYPGVLPFAPGMKKVVKRFLWEVEMRKKWLEGVQRRYREFTSSGTSLDYSLEDLELDDSARQENA
jgi:hypothetical protein